MPTERWTRGRIEAVAEHIRARDASRKGAVFLAAVAGVIAVPAIAVAMIQPVDTSIAIAGVAGSVLFSAILWGIFPLGRMAVVLHGLLGLLGLGGFIAVLVRFVAEPSALASLLRPSSCVIQLFPVFVLAWGAFGAARIGRQRHEAPDPGDVADLARRLRARGPCARSSRSSAGEEETRGSLRSTVPDWSKWLIVPLGREVLFWKKDGDGAFVETGAAVRLQLLAPRNVDACLSFHREDGRLWTGDVPDADVAGLLRALA